MSLVPGPCMHSIPGPYIPKTLIQYLNTSTAGRYLLAVGLIGRLVQARDNPIPHPLRERQTRETMSGGGGETRDPPTHSLLLPPPPPSSSLTLFRRRRSRGAQRDWKPGPWRRATVALNRAGQRPGRQRRLGPGYVWARMGPEGATEGPGKVAARRAAWARDAGSGPARAEGPGRRSVSPSALRPPVSPPVRVVAVAIQCPRRCVWPPARAAGMPSRRRRVSPPGAAAGPAGAAPQADAADAAHGGQEGAAAAARGGGRLRRGLGGLPPPLDRRPRPRRRRRLRRRMSLPRCVPLTLSLPLSLPLSLSSIFPIRRSQFPHRLSPSGLGLSPLCVLRGTVCVCVARACAWVCARVGLGLDLGRGGCGCVNAFGRARVCMFAGARAVVRATCARARGRARVYMFARVGCAPVRGVSLFSPVLRV